MQIFGHAQAGVAQVYAVKIGNDVEDTDERDQAFRYLAPGLNGDSAPPGTSTVSLIECYPYSSSILMRTAEAEANLPSRHDKERRVVTKDVETQVNLSIAYVPQFVESKDSVEAKMKHIRMYGLPLLCLLALLVTSVMTVVIRAQTKEDDGSIARQFVGTWQLVSWPERLADGTTRQNPKNRGYLIYTDNGHVCFVGMNSSRPKWSSTPTANEMASGLVSDGFNAYCGTVEVHVKEGFVLHHIEIDKSPNWIGRTRKRFFRFEGPDRIVLTMDPAEDTPPVVESTLIWERVKQ